MKKSISVITIVSLFSSLLLPTVVIAEDSEPELINSNGIESTIVSEDTKDTAGESPENNEKSESVDNVGTDLSKSNQDNVAINSDQSIVENESLFKEEKETAPAPNTLNDHAMNTESTVIAKAHRNAATPETAFTVSGGTIVKYDVTLGGTDVVIPESINGTSITAIGDAAFSSAGITSVIFPSTVTRIGRYAFYGNSNLTNVQFPTSLTDIGAGAFTACGLTSVDIPSSVIEIGSAAFHMNKLTDATVDSRFIGISSFSANPLVNLKLGENVKWIEENAFARTTIDHLTIPPNVERVHDYAFSQSRINKLTLSEGLKYIGRRAFEHSRFSTLKIPDTVETIEEGAFEYGALNALTIGKGVKHVASNVFAYNSITTVDFGTVETIGDSAFLRNKFEELTLPDSLIAIGVGSFNYNNIHTIHWGNGVKSIGSIAFTNNQLKKLTVTAEEVGLNAFAGNPLEEVTLTDSVRTVRRGAFRGGNYPTLKKIDLGQGVETIETEAFSDGLLESLQIPASLKEAGNAFSYNQLAYVEPGSTNLKTNYGRQRLDAKNVVSNGLEKTITINLKELYPGIDPSKVAIIEVKYGKSVYGSPFTYDSTTGELVFESGGSTYSTIYYEYKVDGKTVLSVEQRLNYINRWHVTWKDWDDSIFQEDVLEKIYGSGITLMVTFPTNSPTRLGYSFHRWVRENYGGGYPELRIESNTSFKASYTQNKYQLNYNYNYPNGAERIDKDLITWEEIGLNARKPDFFGYDFLGWEYDGQLVLSTDTVATLLNNVDPGDSAEITFTARWAKKKVYMTVPDTIDFGSQKLTKGTQYYKATVQGDSLAVYDERGRGSKWQVTAKLTNELTNTLTNKKLENALIYKESSNEKILSSSAAQIIRNHTTSKDSEVTKISDSWTERQGLLLKVEQGKANLGEYTGAIEWTLNDAP